MLKHLHTKRIKSMLKGGNLHLITLMTFSQKNLLKGYFNYLTNVNVISISFYSKMFLFFLSCFSNAWDISLEVCDTLNCYNSYPYISYAFIGYLRHNIEISLNDFPFNKELNDSNKICIYYPLDYSNSSGSHLSNEQTNKITEWRTNSHPTSCHDEQLLQVCWYLLYFLINGLY